MERTWKILRRSIHTFLQNYHFFTSTPALLALPFSVAILLSQTLSPPTLLHARLRALFDAAGFPTSSQFISILCLKLSQTLSSFSFALPCSLTFLLVSKASVILLLSHHKLSLFPSAASFFGAYRSLLRTYVCNSLVILSANATAFSILFIAFNSLSELSSGSSTFALFLSALAAILYSVVLAHALVICNFALVLSGTEMLGGFEAILEACVLIQIPRALALAIPLNLGWAATEALFQYRVVRAYRIGKGPSFTVALEGLFIAYLYSILIVLDTIVTCTFLRSCKRLNYLLHLEDGHCCRVDITEDAEDMAPAQKSEF